MGRTKWAWVDWQDTDCPRAPGTMWACEAEALTTIPQETQRGRTSLSREVLEPRIGIPALLLEAGLSALHGIKHRGRMPGGLMEPLCSREPSRRESLSAWPLL